MGRQSFSLKIKTIVAKPFGPVTIVWSAQGNRPLVARIMLSRNKYSAADIVYKQFGKLPASSCTEIDAIAMQIKTFLAGKNIQFDLSLVDLDLCSDFQRLVLRTEHSIPWGSISTYRLIAACLGKPNGARAVGSALAKNPFPIIVPCHRTIRSDGHPGDYQGGPAMKRALLEKEGMLFDKAGRAVLAKFHSLLPNQNPK